MKFKEMPYTRPDLKQVTDQMTEMTKALAEASSDEEARAVFLKWDEE